MIKYLNKVQISDLKQSRTLASEITKTGATLFDLLAKEINIKVCIPPLFNHFQSQNTSFLQPIRQKSVNKHFESSEIEDGVKKAITVVKKEIEDTNQLIDNISVTEANLDAKIERRKVEIDRYEKRLQTLKKVRFV